MSTYTRCCFLVAAGNRFRAVTAEVNIICCVSAAVGRTTPPAVSGAIALSASTIAMRPAL